MTPEEQRAGLYRLCYAIHAGALHNQGVAWHDAEPKRTLALAQGVGLDYPSLWDIWHLFHWHYPETRGAGLAETVRLVLAAEEPQVAGALDRVAILREVDEALKA